MAKDAYLTIDLNSPLALPEVLQVDVGVPSWDELNSIVTFTVVAHTADDTASSVCTWVQTLSNTISMKADRQTEPKPGLRIDDLQRYVILSTRSTPTAYTDAINAWKAGADSDTRRIAFGEYLVAAAHLGPGYEGTVRAPSPDPVPVP